MHTEMPVFNFNVKGTLQESGSFGDSREGAQISECVWCDCERVCLVYRGRCCRQVTSPLSDCFLLAYMLYECNGLPINYVRYSDTAAGNVCLNTVCADGL